MAMSEESENAFRHFRETLFSDLTQNAKPVIMSLTMLAEDYSKCSVQIARAIEEYIMKVKPDIKILGLYMMDSIMKNLGSNTNYINIFERSVVNLFVKVFNCVDETNRKALFKLRQTWNEVFPNKTLYDIDVNIQKIDHAWPITAVAQNTPLASSNKITTNAPPTPVKPVQINNNKLVNTTSSTLTTTNSSIEARDVNQNESNRSSLRVAVGQEQQVIQARNLPVRAQQVTREQSTVSSNSIASSPLTSDQQVKNLVAELSEMNAESILALIKDPRILNKINKKELASLNGLENSAERPSDNEPSPQPIAQNHSTARKETTNVISKSPVKVTQPQQQTNVKEKQNNSQSNVENIVKIAPVTVLTGVNSVNALKRPSVVNTQNKVDLKKPKIVASGSSPSRNANSAAPTKVINKPATTGSSDMTEAVAKNKPLPNSKLIGQPQSQPKTLTSTVSDERQVKLTSTSISSLGKIPKKQDKMEVESEPNEANKTSAKSPKLVTQTSSEFNNLKPTNPNVKNQNMDTSKSIKKIPSIFELDLNPPLNINPTLTLNEISTKPATSLTVKNSTPNKPINKPPGGVDTVVATTTTTKSVQIKTTKTTVEGGGSTLTAPKIITSPTVNKNTSPSSIFNKTNVTKTVTKTLVDKQVAVKTTTSNNTKMDISSNVNETQIPSFIKSASSEDEVNKVKFAKKALTKTQNPISQLINSIQNQDSTPMETSDDSFKKPDNTSDTYGDVDERFKIVENLALNINLNAIQSILEQNNLLPQQNTKETIGSSQATPNTLTPPTKQIVANPPPLNKLTTLNENTKNNLSPKQHTNSTNKQTSANQPQSSQSKENLGDDLKKPLVLTNSINNNSVNSSQNTNNNNNNNSNKTSTNTNSQTISKKVEIESLMSKEAIPTPAILNKKIHLNNNNNNNNNSNNNNNIDNDSNDYTKEFSFDELPRIKPRDMNQNQNDSLLLIDGRPYIIQPDVRTLIKIYYNDHELFCDTRTKDVYIDGKRVSKMGDSPKEILLNGRRVRFMYMGKRIELWIDGISFHFRADSQPKQISLTPTKRYYVTIDSRTMSMYFDDFKVCQINGGPYGNGPNEIKAKLSPDDFEHDISFVCPPKRIMIDGIPRNMRYDLVVPCVEMEPGKFNAIKFSGGPREIYIDDIPYKVPIDSKGIRIKLNGRPHDLAWGGPGFEVIIDGRPYELQFDRPPREIIIGTKPHQVYIGGDPPDVKIGGRLPPDLIDQNQISRSKFYPDLAHTSGHTNKFENSNQPKKSTTAQLATNILPQTSSQLNVHEIFKRLIDFNILPTTSSSKSSSPSSSQSLSQLQPSQLPPIILQTSIPGLKLPESTLPKTTVPSAATTAAANSVKEEEKVPELMSFDTDLLKQKYPGAINSLYSGIQCATCGNRFNQHDQKTSSTGVNRYARHLDWHFRQNKKDKDEINKAHSRAWYYSFKEWILYEEISEETFIQNTVNTEREESRMTSNDEFSQNDNARKQKRHKKNPNLNVNIDNEDSSSNEEDTRNDMDDFDPSDLTNKEITSISNGNGTNSNTGGTSLSGSSGANLSSFPATTSDSYNNGLPTCPASNDIGDSCCICNDPFEIFWFTDKEEWHFKDAIRRENRLYHPICFEDAREENTSMNASSLNRSLSLTQDQTNQQNSTAESLNESINDKFASIKSEPIN